MEEGERFVTMFRVFNAILKLEDLQNRVTQLERDLKNHETDINHIVDTQNKCTTRIITELKDLKDWKERKTKFPLSS